MKVVEALEGTGEEAIEIFRNLWESSKDGILEQSGQQHKKLRVAFANELEGTGWMMPGNESRQGRR